MTKDYRRGAPPRRRGVQRRGTCAFWFLLGGMLGAFAVGYAWMTQEPAMPEGGTTATAPRPAPEPARERTFDFYSLLPEEEVVIPADADTAPESPPLPPTPAKPEQDAMARSQAPSAPSTPAAPAGGSGDYRIQVGSFRKSADAERLKAKLALLGIQTGIETVTIDSGQTYHRVRTGAYSRERAESLQAQLEREGLESMMMRSR